MKKIIISGLLVASSLFATAQIKVGVQAGFITTPSDLKTGLVSESFGPGLGAGITVRKALTDNISVGANLGFYKIGSPSDLPSGFEVSAWVLPLAVAGEYYFMTEGFKPFVGAEIGTAFAHFGFDFAGMSESATERGMYIAPVAGFAYGLTDAIDFTFSAKYALFTPGASSINSQTADETANWSHAGINAGIAIAFGE